MNTTLIIGILLMIGAAQGILLAVVLFSSAGDRKTANRSLAVLLLLFSFMLFFHAYSELQGEMLEKTGQEYFTQSIFSLFAPLILYYVRALTQSSFVFHWKETFHLLPFSIIIIFSLAFTLFPVNPSWAQQLNLLMPFLMIIQMTIYLYLSLRLLQAHKLYIESNFSALEMVVGCYFYICHGVFRFTPACNFLRPVCGVSGKRFFDQKKI